MSPAENSPWIHEIGNLIGLTIELLVAFGAISLWVLGVFLSKDKSLRVVDFVKAGIADLIPKIIKFKGIFIPVIVFLFLQQGLNIFAPTPHAGESLQQYGKNAFIDLLRVIANLGMISGWVICPYLILRQNLVGSYDAKTVLDAPKGALRNMIIANVCSFALQAAGAIVVIPGIIFSNIFWIAGAVAIAEHRSVTAIGRCKDLAKGHFWDVAKIAMLFQSVVAFSSVPSTFMETFHMSRTLVASADAAGNIINFLVLLVSWQCQWALYKHLNSPVASPVSAVGE